MSTISVGQQLFHQVRIRRGLLFGAIIVGALLAFEIFNYSTTEFALSDLLGDLKFAGIRWATILSIAFCGIDFELFAANTCDQDDEMNCTCCTHCCDVDGTCLPI